MPIASLLYARFFDQSHQINSFLQFFFSRPNPKTVIQVGANDGVMSDPLRPFLMRPGSYRAILIEPVPFYADKLRELYADRHDIEILNAAAGPAKAVRPLYFISPDVANQMDGDGPPNGWAHGQGSFDKDNIIHWIRQNQFRGPEYVRKMPLFIDSISAVEVPVLPLRDVVCGGDHVMLVVDVQGFELEVLQGLNWDDPPSTIMFEDDREGNGQVVELLKLNGYRHVCGRTDKIFVRD